MTIENAIENLTYYLQTHSYHFNSNLYNSVNLGIEGLKRLLGDREAIPADKFFRLPGETDK